MYAGPMGTEQAIFSQPKHISNSGVDFSLGELENCFQKLLISMINSPVSFAFLIKMVEKTHWCFLLDFS